MKKLGDAAGVLFVALLLAAPAHCSDHVFPSGLAVSVTRAPSHLYVVPGDPIEVQVTISNNTSGTLRGVYYTEHIPAVFNVETVDVSIDGALIQDYTYEMSSDDIYARTDCHRWILEEPGKYGEADNPLPSGSVLTINYRIIAPGYYWDEWPPYFFACERDLPVPEYCFGYCDETLLINEDTDGDGLVDVWEILFFSDLSSDGTGDGDGDSLTDLDEYQFGTDPLLIDTDADGFGDYLEVNNNSSPTDENDTPPAVRVNFQPAASLCPEGYCSSTHALYTARGYGWL